MKGEGNHQYGLKGPENATFKTGKRINTHGYRLVYIKNHPMAYANDYVREHRYVVESNHDLFPEEAFVLIDDNFYLRPEYDVHHKDGDKLNNSVENLEVLSRSSHTRLHNRSKKIIRNDKGRIIGVIKLGELLETPEEDNQQPSSANSIKSS